ncbi:MAG: hypothetical protein J4469_03035 [Candidatus Aenigmarchaeota archaeon]|nr:hypothetical protein [Candidatus Aenigmarchaeota archaeon]
MANGNQARHEQPEEPEQPGQPAAPAPGQHEPDREEPMGRRLGRWASYGLYGLGGAVTGLSAFDYAITNWRVDSLPHLVGNVALGSGLYFIGRGAAALSQEEAPRIREEDALRQFVAEVERGPVELPDGRRIVIQQPEGPANQEQENRGVIRRTWDRTADGYRRLSSRGATGYFALGLAAWIFAAGAYTAVKPWKYVRDEAAPATVSYTKEEAIPRAADFGKKIYYGSTGLKRPDIWGESCKYIGEPDESHKAIMEGLFPETPDKYVPVELDCRPERVFAGLEYSDPAKQGTAYANFAKGAISEVELADSRPGVHTLGGKRYIWSPVNFHREK